MPHTLLSKRQTLAFPTERRFDVPCCHHKQAEATETVTQTDRLEYAAGNEAGEAEESSSGFTVLC